MKRLTVLALFAVLFTPLLASAYGGGRDHKKISATELITSGFVAAGAIGVAGYLILRRRHAN